MKGLVLMTPFYIEPNAKDPMRRTMDQYGEVVKKMAIKYDARFVDTQAAFYKVLAHSYPVSARLGPRSSEHYGTCSARTSIFGSSSNTTITVVCK